ncbi:MAG: hypothetical protein U0871_19905 [Gemmataceae bacterium]
MGVDLVDQNDPLGLIQTDALVQVAPVGVTDDGCEQVETSRDRCRNRRPLSADERSRLVPAARGSGLVYRGMADADRAVQSAVATATGFRAAELASLTPAAFDLAAEHAENGTTAVQPLPPDLVAKVGGYLRSRGTRRRPR